jgi:hypothetical protein
MKTINVEGLDTIFVTGSMEEMESIAPVLKAIGFTQIKDRPNAYQFETGINAPLGSAFDEDHKITYMGMPISETTATKIANAIIEEVKLRIGYNKEPRFSHLVDEVNKDWTPGYSATAVDDTLIIISDDKEVARIDYDGGRYTVSGEDKDAVDQLEFMVNR